MNDHLMEELIHRVMLRLEDEKLLETSSTAQRTLCIGFTPEEQSTIENSGVNDLSFVTEIPKDFCGDEIWIHHLSVEDLMSLSLGLSSSYGNLISLLIRGTTIKFFWEESSIKEVTPFLKNKISTAIKNLTRMGFVFEELSLDSLQERLSLQQDDVHGENIYTGKLITEETVMNLPESIKTLYVDPSALITPLAQDMLKAKNINCIKKDCLSLNRKESVDEGR